jgi:hypothetical protein
MPVWLAMQRINARRPREFRGILLLVFDPVRWRDDVHKDRLTGPPHVFCLAVRAIGAVSNLGQCIDGDGFDLDARREVPALRRTSNK